jgi:glycosyltransferase involved in cell wall biosynthesis
MTKVSVVIPTFNRANAISRAIDSTLQQTVSDIEVLVVDDASTDATSEVVEAYDDDRIEYIRHSQNQGANAARNTGIEVANGEYVSFLDSDDELHPEHLEKVLAALAESSDCCIGAFTSFKRVDDGLIDLSIASRTEVTASDLKDGNLVGTLSCTTFHSKVFTEIGNFDDNLRASQDIDFYLRVLESYTMVGIDEILVVKHEAGDNIGGNLQRKRQGFEQIRKKHGDVISQKYESKMHQVEGQLLAIEGDTNRAREKFSQSIKVRPSNVIGYYFYVASLFGKAGFRGAFLLAQWVQKELKKRRYQEYL